MTELRQYYFPHYGKSKTKKEIYHALYLGVILTKNNSLRHLVRQSLGSIKSDDELRNKVATIIYCVDNSQKRKWNFNLKLTNFNVFFTYLDGEVELNIEKNNNTRQKIMKK
jgi:hypothetical protein